MEDGIIELPIDFWNTTNAQINQMYSLLQDIISKALENPTSIEVLDKAWFDAIFYNVIRYPFEFEFSGVNYLIFVQNAHV